MLKLLHVAMAFAGLIMRGFGSSDDCRDLDIAGTPVTLDCDTSVDLPLYKDKDTEDMCADLPRMCKGSTLTTRASFCLGTKVTMYTIRFEVADHLSPYVEFRFKDGVWTRSVVNFMYRDFVSQYWGQETSLDFFKVLEENTVRFIVGDDQMQIEGNDEAIGTFRIPDEIPLESVERVCVYVDCGNLVSIDIGTTTCSPKKTPDVTPKKTPDVALPTYMVLINFWDRFGPGTNFANSEIVHIKLNLFAQDNDRVCADMPRMCDGSTLTTRGSFCLETTATAYKISFEVDRHVSPYVEFRFVNGKWVRSVVNFLYGNAYWGEVGYLHYFGLREENTMRLTVVGDVIQIEGNDEAIGTFNIPDEIPLETVERVCVYSGCGKLASIDHASTCLPETSTDPVLPQTTTTDDVIPKTTTTNAVLPQTAIRVSVLPQTTKDPVLPNAGTDGLPGNCDNPEAPECDKGNVEALGSLLGGSSKEKDWTAWDTASALESRHINMTVEQTLTTVGLSCSMACLLVTVVVEMHNGNLKKTTGKIMTSLSMSLFSAQFLFLFVDYPFTDKVTCKVVAILEHLFWLLAVAWSNAMIVDLLRVIASTAANQRPDTSYWLYLVVATILPCSIVGACVVLDSQTSMFRYGVPGLCWIDGTYAVIYAFATPVAASVTINIALLIYVFVLIYRIRAITRSLGDDAFLTHRRSAIIGLKLASVMGLTWIFGVLGAFLGNSILLYFFSVTNSIQGVTMFFGLCYNYDKVKTWIKAKCGRREVSQAVSVISTPKMSGGNSREESPIPKVRACCVCHHCM